MALGSIVGKQELPKLRTDDFQRELFLHALSGDVTKLPRQFWRVQQAHEGVRQRRGILARDNNPAVRFAASEDICNAWHVGADDRQPTRHCFQKCHRESFPSRRDGVHVCCQEIRPQFPAFEHVPVDPHHLVGRIDAASNDVAVAAVSDQQEPNVCVWPS
jgi:hypothetical protein